MNNISIADYLKLREVRDYLENEHDFKMVNNNGFTSQPADDLKRMIENMDNILNKLEQE